MDPVTIGLIISLAVSATSTGLSLGKANQANLKAKAEGEKQLVEARALTAAELISQDAEFIRLQRQLVADRRTKAAALLASTQKQSRNLAIVAGLSLAVSVALLVFTFIKPVPPAPPAHL